MELEPLSAFDWRIIHQALKDDPGIETHSVEVEGTDKKPSAPSEALRELRFCFRQRRRCAFHGGGDSKGKIQLPCIPQRDFMHYPSI